MKAGEPLDIALGVSGTPTPTVSWEKNGRPVDNRVIFIFWYKLMTLNRICLPISF